MSKNLKAKYYQEDKDKACERYQNLFKEKKATKWLCTLTKISQKIKKINWLSIKKMLWNEKNAFL